MGKNKKRRVDVVYSTNPDFSYEHEDEGSFETLPPNEQDLRVMLDRKMRNGKAVTLVTGFVGNEDNLKELAHHLKSACGVGGTAKDGEILVQGDHRKKVLEVLTNKGYNAKQSGG